MGLISNALTVVVTWAAAHPEIITQKVGWEGNKALVQHPGVPSQSTFLNQGNGEDEVQTLPWRWT